MGRPRRLSPIAVAVFFAVASASAQAKPQAPAAEDAPAEAPPRVVVPVVLGLEAKKATSAHKLVVTALQKTLGPRFVSAADAVQAQLDQGISTADLQSAAGVERLAKATGAERVVVVTVQDTKTVVAVYATLTGAPPLLLEAPRKKTAPLNAAWAQRVATLVKTRAENALAPRIEAPVIDLGEPEPEPEAPPPVVVAPVPPAPKPAPPAPSAPVVVVAVGGALSGRAVELSGPLASKVSPMNLGAVPSVSAYVAFSPLRLVANDAWWSDLLLELSGRRGFLDARGGGATCTVDDDEIGAALSFRARVADSPWLPRLGGGASIGHERFLIGGCDVPALSVQSTQAAGFVRVAQPLWPGHVELDVLGGARVPLVGEGSSFERPGALGHVAVTATPLPFFQAFYVRALARVAESRLTVGPGPDLVVGDTRAHLELQLGGAL